MIGYNKTPLFVRTRVPQRPDAEVLRDIVDTHLENLEQQIADFSEGEFVIAIHPAPTGSAWDVLTSWGEPA